jgi:hypothetical protein
VIEIPEALSPEDLERLYGERTCPWPECDYVATGEWELGRHAEVEHGVRPPSFLIGERTTAQRLEAIEGRLEGIDENVAMLLQQVAVPFVKLLDRLERSPWGRLLK